MRQNNVYANPRINRNIVECKFNHHVYAANVFTELIETLWNVNVYSLSSFVSDNVN